MALSQCIKRRHLAQKNLKFHAGVKKCHFGNFSERAGMAVPCQCSPQESLGGSEKFFLHWVPMNSQQCWKAKLERALFCRVQSGKITVWQIFVAFSEKLNFNVVVPRYCNSSPLALRLPTSGPMAASSPAASSSAALSQPQVSLNQPLRLPMSWMDNAKEGR